MKQIVVLSGKGGTGKTTVTAALAHLASREARLVMVDADVDAANLELVLSPRKLETHRFLGGKVAVIDQDSCRGCSICSDVCRFEAVKLDRQLFRVDPIACEGCASCSYQCPSQAIRMEDRVAGEWFVSETRFGPLVHARLLAGQENSGKLVAEVRQRAREIGRQEDRDYVIVDGPPGIGCAVIAASSGVDLALLVAEPTIAGVHDLERALATTDHFQVPALVVINKYDLNPTHSSEIEALCGSRDVPVVGHIPFDTAVTEAMVQGRTVTEHADGRLREELERLWEGLRGQAERQGKRTGSP